jgi:hypothetical protein
MFRPFRHRRLAAGAALIAAAAVVGGCTPKDYGADFPKNFAGLNKEIVAHQDKLDKRLPELRTEINHSSLKLRRELRDYQSEAANFAARLSHYNKPEKVEARGNSLAASLRDEEQTLDMLRQANRMIDSNKNREGNHRFAHASLTQLADAVRAVDGKRPEVARIGRELGRS